MMRHKFANDINPGVRRRVTVCFEEKLMAVVVEVARGGGGERGAQREENTQ